MLYRLGINVPSMVLILDGKPRTCCAHMKENGSFKREIKRLVKSLDLIKRLKTIQITEIALNVRNYTLVTI